MYLEYGIVAKPEEVDQILALQALNHFSALDEAQMLGQGFLTVKHEPALLHLMNQTAPSVVAKDGDQVVAYALMMPRSFGDQIPVLIPMFEVIESLSWRGKSLKDQISWFVMGQVCVGAGYRGIGVFDGLYKALNDEYADTYELIITEIAERNTRSIKAHERVGFQTLHVYEDENTKEIWRLVILEIVKEN